MTLYAFRTFFHASAAVLMFVALGIEAVAAGQLREATAVASARSWDRVRRRSVGAGLIAVVTVLASGIAMMALRWGPRAWIITGFAGLVVIGVAAVAAALRARARLDAAMGHGPQGSAEGALDRRAQPIARPAVRVVADAALFSVRLRAAIGIAVLGLMTLRPGALASITILAAAIALVIVHGSATIAGRRSVRAGAAAP